MSIEIIIDKEEKEKMESIPVDWSKFPMFPTLPMHSFKRVCPPEGFNYKLPVRRAFVGLMENDGSLFSDGDGY